MNSKTQLTFTWIALLGLTFAGAWAPARWTLALGFLKFLGISLIFMELRHAHLAWRLGLGALAAGALIICVAALGLH